MINPYYFGNCDKHVVERSLKVSSFLLEIAAGVQSPRPFTIQPKADNPECCNYGDKRIIFLAAEGDYWGQWVYQFAHEYCHHLINGPMTGAMRGLFWFEESLCELASQYVLARLSDEQLCNTSGLRIANRVFQSYHEHLSNKSRQLEKNLDWTGTVHKWLPVLEEPEYHRGHYSVIASKMLPIFLEQPHSWKIIAHIGDSAQYKSLEELFSHLETACPLECHDVVYHLRLALLGA